MQAGGGLPPDHGELHRRGGHAAAQEDLEGDHWEEMLTKQVKTIIQDVQDPYHYWVLRLKNYGLQPQTL